MLSMQISHNNYSHTMKPLEDYFGARTNHDTKKGSIDMTSIRNTFRLDNVPSPNNTQLISTESMGYIPNIPYFQNAYAQSQQPQQQLAVSNIVPNQQQQQLYSVPVQSLPLQHSAYTNSNSPEVYQNNNNTYNQSIPVSYQLPQASSPNVPGIINFDHNVRPIMVTMSPKDRQGSIQMNNNTMMPINYTFVASPGVDYNSPISVNSTYISRNPSLAQPNTNFNTTFPDRQNRNLSYSSNATTTVVTPNGQLPNNNNASVIMYNRSHSHPTISQNINVRDITQTSPLLVSNQPGTAFLSDMGSNNIIPTSTQSIQKLKNKYETPVSVSSPNVAASPSNSISTSTIPVTSKSQPSSLTQLTPSSEVTSNTPTIASLLVNDQSDTHNKDEKLYKCSVCNKSFLRAAWLRRHVLTHTSYRQFQCIWCSSKHKRRDNLFKHIKIKHMDYLMDSIQDFYPLAHFETRDLNKLLKSGQLHREDIKKVILSIIKKGQEQNLELKDKERIQQR